MSTGLGQEEYWAIIDLLLLISCDRIQQFRFFIGNTLSISVQGLLHEIGQASFNPATDRTSTAVGWLCQERPEIITSISVRFFATSLQEGKRMRRVLSCFCMLSLLGISEAEQRFESFDRDPGWDAHQNRILHPETIRQDFGYSTDTAHAGGARGEVGGTIQPAAEAAYFALPLAGLNLQTPFSASGKLFVRQGGGHFLLGFFNDSTQNEWRTPNTAVFRIIQRGEVFYCYPEYCSAKWRTASGVVGNYNADTDRFTETELPADTTYTWSLAYEPDANDGEGRFIAHFGEHEIVTALDPKIKEDGAYLQPFWFAASDETVGQCRDGMDR